MRSISACLNAMSLLAAVLPFQFGCGDSGGNDTPNTTPGGMGVTVPGAIPGNPAAPSDPANPSNDAVPLPAAGTNEGGVPVNGGISAMPPADATDPERDENEQPSPGAIDPIAILRELTPTDPDLAADYEDYITAEVGPLTVGTVGTGTARTITQTIFVPPGQVYDGLGETLTASGMGDGSQDEGQRPIFLLAPGASVKNVTITAPGVEGIHMMGDNVVENVVWLDVGEDAASVRSYFPGGDILITGGSATSSADKTFQFNVPCDVTIENFTANDIGKLVRQNGGTTFPLNITLDNVTANDVRDVLVLSDSPDCVVRFHNLNTDAESLFEGELTAVEF